MNTFRTNVPRQEDLDKDDGVAPVSFPLLLLQDPLGTLPEELTILLDEHCMTLHSVEFGIEDVDLLRQTPEASFIVRWVAMLFS